MTDNPLLQDFDLPHGVPPFDKIDETHFLPAVKEFIARAQENIHALKNNAEDSSFENTIVALETASEQLGIVMAIFYNQLNAAGTDTLEKLAHEIGPLQANFASEVAMDPLIFQRVKSVYNQKEGLNLSNAQAKLLEDTYIGFVRGGALLDDEGKEALRKINEEISTLGPAFANNVKKSSEAFELLITDEKTWLACHRR